MEYSDKSVFWAQRNEHELPDEKTENDISDVECVSHQTKDTDMLSKVNERLNIRRTPYFEESAE